METEEQYQESKCFRCSCSFKEGSWDRNPISHNIRETLCQLCENYFCTLKATKKISWNELLPQGSQWLESSGILSYIRQYNHGISTYLAIKIPSEDEKQLEQKVLSGLTDAETFLGDMKICLQIVRKESYRIDIFKVLRAYIAKNPQVGYCEGLNIVCAWLLMFFDVNSAMWVLSYLIEKVLLPDFYIGNKHGNSVNGIYIESSVITEVLEMLMPGVRQGCLPTEQFSSFFSYQPLVNLFVNVVNFECTLFIWDKLMNQGSIALINGTVSLAMVCEQDIINGEHPLKIIKSLYGRNIDEQLQDLYLKCDKVIDQGTVESMRVNAKKFRAKQWLNCEKILIKRLENCSNFNLNEILDIQQIFNTMIEEKEKRLKKIKFFRRSNTMDVKQINDISGLESSCTGISKTEFMKVISKFNKNLKHSAGILFEQFDEDKSGNLDFRELTLCISVFWKGTFEEKLRVCFDAYDKDKSGYLQAEEIENLINNLLKQYQKYKNDEEDRQSIQIVEEITKRLRDLCEQFNGILCFEDFSLAVKTDPMLYSCFFDHFGQSTGNTSEYMRKISKEKESGPFVVKKCQSCWIF